ncbi:unnamed protein product [Pylaiella littoralis]
MSSFMQDTRDPEEELGLLELLGEGSYGAVYRAEQRADDREVAVKIIPADNPIDLLKEVDIMMACTSPYIVRLHDCFYKDNEAWLVMDFVGGGSVSDILEACEVTLSEAEAKECTAWTVLALDYLHSNRKLHRDVKAGNILLTLDGRAKLADFGVSKEVNTMANKAQTAIGTPYWMAPEVIQEVPYDGQADIWSLAITCIEMVEGNPPLNNVHPMRAIFMIPSKPSPTLSEPAKWSLEFNDFVGRCLEKKPEDRPSSRAILRHPWIAASVERIQGRGGKVGSAVIQDLVTKHLPILTSFREDASTAKANMAGEDNEECSGYKTATLRRMSSTRGGEPYRGNGSPDPAFFGAHADEADARERTPEGDLCDDEGGDDESSSGGSVIRVPMVGSEEEEEEDDDDCSSNGSVIRVGANEGACSLHGSVLRAFVGSDTYEDDGNCSDDSVVKVPAGKTSSDGNAKGQGPTFEETPHRAVEGLGLETGPGYQDNDENGKELGKTGQAPAHMKMNLLAASKYFGSKGGASDGGPGAAREGERGGLAHISQKDDGNPQAKALLDELERLDVNFANDLSRLRQTYDSKKANLQAQLRRLLDSQRSAVV